MFDSLKHDLPFFLLVCVLITILHVVTTQPLFVQLKNIHIHINLTPLVNNNIVFFFN